MNRPYSNHPLLASAFTLLVSAGATATPLQLHFQGKFDRVNTYDGATWTYDTPIPPVTWDSTVRFDDVVFQTSESASPGFLVRYTFFSGPIETTPTPMTPSMLAMNPGSFPMDGASAYIVQGCFGSPDNCGGQTFFVAGNWLYGSDLDPDPDITRRYMYDRWIGPGINGPASGTSTFADVSFFTTAELIQFLEDALRDSYPVWNYESIGVYSSNAKTGEFSTEWALQYAGSGTLLGIPEPATVALGALGLAALGFTRRRRT